jgi:hypothetical protein
MAVADPLPFKNVWRGTTGGGRSIDACGAWRGTGRHQTRWTAWPTSAVPFRIARAAPTAVTARSAEMATLTRSKVAGRLVVQLPTASSVQNRSNA